LVVLASTPTKDTGCSGNYSLVRDAQLQAISETSFTFAVSAVDLGDTGSPLGAIHPRNKSEVGRRLGDQIAYNVYGLGSQVTFQPPVLGGMAFPFGFLNFGSVTLYFSYSIPSGLPPVMTQSNTPSCTQCCTGTGAISSQWMGDDGTNYSFYINQISFSTASNTTVVISATLTLSSSSFPSNQQPHFPLRLLSVSHARTDFVECILRGPNEIPAWPFYLEKSQGWNIQQSNKLWKVIEINDRIIGFNQQSDIEIESFIDITNQ
jgi:hypothetical protein